MNQVIYEDNHLLAVHKDAGSLTHNDVTGDESIEDRFKKYLKKKYNKPGNVFLTPVHRLDRPVSGLLLMARTSKALPRLTKAFAGRDVVKKYLAVVQDAPQELEGRLTHYLQKDHKKNMTKAFLKPTEGAKKAILDFRTIGRIGERYLLEITPLTGRSHQIRVQLATIGCNIIGDVKYGSTQKWAERSMALHSYSLTFMHPTKKEVMTLKCPLPENEFWKRFEGIAE